MNQLHHNAPEIAGLTAEERQIVERGASAIESLKRTFDQWMDIGRGLKVLRARADELKGRETFQRLAEQAGYGGMFRSASGKINRSVISHLVDIVEHEDQVRAWRDGLTEDQRWAWVSPTSIKRWCPAFTKKAEKSKKKTRPSKFDAA